MIFLVYCSVSLFDMLLWRCWLGNRKDIRSVESLMLICWWWRFDWSYLELFHLIAPVVASVVKQYNLVPVNGRWYLAAGKVTVDLASHWPHVTPICCSPHKGCRPTGGRWAPTHFEEPIKMDTGVVVFMTLMLPMSEETNTPVSHNGHWRSCNRC